MPEELPVDRGDALIISFLCALAIEEKYTLIPRSWERHGCNEYYKAEEGRVLFIFDGADTLPDVKTERGKYCFGSYVRDKETGSFVDRIHGFLNLRVERGFKVPDDGPSGPKYQYALWGPVLSASYVDMLEVAQRSTKGATK